MKIEKYNLEVYREAVKTCFEGPELIERGQKYRTWDTAQLTFDANESMLFNIPARKLNVRYAVEEFLWYVRANKYDDSIEQHATLWKKLQQPDGSYFSNYGQYIFSKYTPDGINQFRFMFEQLARNPATRRAAIPLLKTEHCFHDNTDMVCTFGIQFFIRNDHLNMVINMRSNDVIWGLTNDAFCFWMIQRMMYLLLKAKTYPDLKMGVYVHNANTLHVYERHYKMAQEIIATDISQITPIYVPMPSDVDVMSMLGKVTDHLEWTKFLDLLPS